MIGTWKMFMQELQLVLASKADARSLLERGLISLGLPHVLGAHITHRFTPVFHADIVADRLVVEAANGWYNYTGHEVAQQVGISCPDGNCIVHFQTYSHEDAHRLSPDIMRFIGAVLRLVREDCVLVDEHELCVGLLRKGGNLQVDSSSYWNWTDDDTGALGLPFEKVDLPSLHRY
jgi:hypothetical protein